VFNTFILKNRVCNRPSPPALFTAGAGEVHTTVLISH